MTNGRATHGVSPLPERAAAPHALSRTRAEEAQRKAAAYMLSIQHDDGHWCAELEGDTILESEYVLTMHFIGQSESPKLRKAAEHIRRRQLDNGGWAIYRGGPPEASSSVKAYFVLKIMGDSAEAPHMVRARRAILGMGGVEACNTFTKIYLAIFGQYAWKRCPAVPPEMMFFPRWFYLNIYAMSSWSRAIVVPLSIIWAHKPQCAVPSGANIPELFAQQSPDEASVAKFVGKRSVWTMFFGALDRSLKLAEHAPWKPTRRRALKRAEQWVLERLEKSDGLGAIFPPIINTILALRCLGYELDHPTLAQQIRELEKLELESEDILRVQPCFSPVWDTALTLNTLLRAGMPRDDPAILAAARWLLDKEVRQTGDWQVRVRGPEPAGWYFEYANEFYPDNDDTAEVLMGLQQVRFPGPAEDARREAAMKRGLEWLLAMQNRDGGWAAFDKDCDKKILTHVPFADHNAMIDPSCEDITGRVLDALKVLGFSQNAPPVQRAIQWLYKQQHADGTWFGRWGCNYIYGTWLVLTGLAAQGGDPADPRWVKAIEWLRTHQNEDGGWGEAPDSYDNPEHKGRGPSTAAQTAWALLTLLACGDDESESVTRGVAYLVETQLEDGSWYDEFWTGTGFPRVFYLRYHYYALYFPLRALSAYLASHATPHLKKAEMS